MTKLIVDRGPDGSGLFDRFDGLHDIEEGAIAGVEVRQDPDLFGGVDGMVEDIDHIAQVDIAAVGTSEQGVGDRRSTHPDALEAGPLCELCRQRIENGWGGNRLVGRGCEGRAEFRDSGHIMSFL